MGEDKLLERIRQFQNGEDVGLVLLDDTRLIEMWNPEKSLVYQVGYIIKDNPLFKNLDNEKMRRYLNLLHAEIKEYNKDEMLHRAGEKMEKFGLVLYGHVQACCDDMDGNRVIMAEVGRNVTFGESIHFLRLEDEPVYIEATEKTKVLWLSLYDVLANPTDATNADILCRFLSILSNRTMTMHDRIVLLSQHSTREKIILYFDILRRKEKSDTFVVPFSREALADYLAVNRSALSRELSKLQEEGIITFTKNRFTLLRK